MTSNSDLQMFQEMSLIFRRDQINSQGFNFNGCEDDVFHTQAALQERDQILDLFYRHIFKQANDLQTVIRSMNLTDPAFAGPQSAACDVLVLDVQAQRALQSRMGSQTALDVQDKELTTQMGDVIPDWLWSGCMPARFCA